MDSICNIPIRNNPLNSKSRHDFVVARIYPGKARGLAGIASPKRCSKKNNINAKNAGGEGGIRTLGTIASTPDFESGTFDHSATSPRCTQL